jgi:hypothetical protein
MLFIEECFCSCINITLYMHTKPEKPVRSNTSHEHHMNFQMCHDAMITISMKKGVAVSSTNCLHVTTLVVVQKAMFMFIHSTFTSAQSSDSTTGPQQQTIMITISCS